MTAPLPTLRRKSGVTEHDELTYREARDRHAQAPRILHLADPLTDYERSLCGRKRDLPLEPNAKGQVCVICAYLYRFYHGHDWDKA